MNIFDPEGMYFEDENRDGVMGGVVGGDRAGFLKLWEFCSLKGSEDEDCQGLEDIKSERGESSALLILRAIKSVTALQIKNCQIHH